MLGLLLLENGTISDAASLTAYLQHCSLPARSMFGQEKYMSLLILLFGLSGLNAIRAQSASADPVIVLRPTIPAYFPGCTQEPEGTDEKAICSSGKLMSYIGKTVVYPQEAREAKIEGVVMLSFVITDSGYVERVRILRDIGGGCAQEAQRVIESMPRWQPAIFKGKTVYTQFTLPITFGLKTGMFDYELHIGELMDGEVLRKELEAALETAPLRVTDPKGAEMKITEVVYTFERGGDRQQLVTRGDEPVVWDQLADLIGRKPGRLTVEANVVEGMDIRTVTKAFVIVK